VPSESVFTKVSKTWFITLNDTVSFEPFGSKLVGSAANANIKSSLFTPPFEGAEPPLSEPGVELELFPHPANTKVKINKQHMILIPFFLNNFPSSLISFIISLTNIAQSMPIYGQSK
jgi:hypothetical protein